MLAALPESEGAPARCLGAEVLARAECGLSLRWDFGPWSTDRDAGKIAGVARARLSLNRAERRV